MTRLDRAVERVWDEHGAEATKLAGLWAKKVENGQHWIGEAKKLIRTWRPLVPHVSITRAGQAASSSRVALSLRFHGNEVAEVRIANGEANLRVSDWHLRQKRSVGAAALVGPLPAGDYPWSRDPRTQAFKTHFSELDRTRGNELPWSEWRLQSDLILQMAGHSGRKTPSLHLKQPVLVSGLPLQVPVPIQANTGRPVFSRSAHVDVLARHGRGRAGHPAVWELKRPKEVSSAVPQVYIYSVTLLRLFRSPAVGTRWYRLLGFGGRLPRSITVDAVVAVSKEQKPALLEQFGEYRLAMPNSYRGDRIEFYAAYYDVSAGRLSIDSFEPLG